MKLLDFVEPQSFASWALTALDHLQEENVARILECAQDPQLQDMAIALEDSAISRDQVLSVLVALDLYFQDFAGLKGAVLEFPALANSRTIGACGQA